MKFAWIIQMISHINLPDSDTQKSNKTLFLHFTPGFQMNLFMSIYFHHRVESGVKHHKSKPTTLTQTSTTKVLIRSTHTCRWNSTNIQVWTISFCRHVVPIISFLSSPLILLGQWKPKWEWSLFIHVQYSWSNCSNISHCLPLHPRWPRLLHFVSMNGLLFKLYLIMSCLQ